MGLTREALITVRIRQTYWLGTRSSGVVGLTREALITVRIRRTYWLGTWSCGPDQEGINNCQNQTDILAWHLE